MDISTLAKKPELIKLTLDSPQVIEEYGEPVDFYMLDNMGLTTYFNFYKLQQEEDDTLLYNLLRRIVLNKEGKPSIAEDSILPVDLVVAILTKISDHLGKSKTKISTLESGSSPK